jgi:hypothetical protein
MGLCWLRLETPQTETPAMSAPAVSVSAPPVARQSPWPPRLAPLLLGLLLVLTLAPGLARADEGQRWSLRDQDDNRWSLRIFAQPDPAYPSGDRLRLSALTPGVAVDHASPLLISDGMGGAWTLANRSEELVPADGGALPEGSAQFDMADLRPRPSGALPLALTLPLSGEASVVLVLGPEETEALHAWRDPGAPAQEG